MGESVFTQDLVRIPLDTVREGLAEIITDDDASTITFDVALSAHHRVTLGGNRTLAVVNDDLNPEFKITLNTGAGGFTPVWWSGITWATGSAPTVSAGAHKEDTFTFVRRGPGDYVGRVLDQAVNGYKVVPDAPTIGVATAGVGQATANWTAPASNGNSAITGYVVKTYLAADDSLLFTDSTGVVLTKLRTGLSNATGVYFKVAAVNAIGTGAQSAASNTVTTASVPGAPTIGAATAGDTTATVNWTAPVSNGGSAITGYAVTLYLASDNSVVSTVTTGVVLTKQFTGLTNGIGVYGKVAAINAVGTGAQSAASNTVTPAP